MPIPQRALNLSLAAMRALNSRCLRKMPLVHGTDTTVLPEPVLGKGRLRELRILVADDHEIVRRGLRWLLEKHGGWEVCGEASDGRECVEKALQLNPDVVVVDIVMPNLNGLDTTRQLLQHDPHLKVIVLTITDSDQVIREVLLAGAWGFVRKSDAASDLVPAIEALCSQD